MAVGQEGRVQTLCVVGIGVVIGRRVIGSAEALAVELQVVSEGLSMLRLARMVVAGAAARGGRRRPIKRKYQALVKMLSAYMKNL